MHATTKTFDNGLKVSAYSFPQMETVGIAFGVRFGSVDEKPRINGSAHFLEHMLFKGTPSRTWKEISDQLKELGVSHNAFTDHETTVYFMRTYKGYFEKVMEILSDMIKNSTLPEKEFELERGPIINENLIHHDNPRYMISDYLPRVLYKKNPANLPVGGDNEKTIINIKRQDLLDFYRRYYSPKNGVLTIYGGIGKEKAFASASRHFGDFQKDYNAPVRTVSREKQERRVITIARKGIKQTRIGIGFKTSEFSKRTIGEFLALLVVERYLDDKLFDEVRQKRGLSYDPMAAYESYNTFGFIAAAAGIAPKKMDETRKVIIKEFEKLQNGEISSRELGMTKKALHVEGKTRKENTAEMSIQMNIFNLTYGSTSLLERMPDLIMKVTLDDVRKYCGKYINVDRYGMVLLKPA